LYLYLRNTFIYNKSLQTVYVSVTLHKTHYLTLFNNVLTQEKLQTYIFIMKTEWLEIRIVVPSEWLVEQRRIIIIVITNDMTTLPQI